MSDPLPLTKEERQKIQDAGQVCLCPTVEEGRRYEALVRLLEARVAQLEAELKKAQHIADIERGQRERFALCPDHRDKATGRCIVCQAEERTRQEIKAERAYMEQQSQQPPAPRRPDLVKFAERILEDWPGWWSLIEAEDIQAIALECGLLERVTVTEPCGDDCACVEYHTFDGEAVECYRRVDLRDAASLPPLGGTNG